MANSNAVVFGRNIKMMQAAFATSNVMPNDNLAWGLIGAPYADTGYTKGGLSLNANIQRGTIEVDQVLDPLFRPVTSRAITLGGTLSEITPSNINQGSGLGSLASLAAITSQAAPVAPTLATAASGGTVLAGTYTVTVSYVTPQGETVESSTATQVTTGSVSTLTVNSPSAAGLATGWYAYVSQVNAGTVRTRQQAAGTPTAIGTNLILTAPPTSTGAAPLTAGQGTAGRGHDDLIVGASVVDQYFAYLADIQQPNAEAFRIFAPKGLASGSPNMQFQPQPQAEIALQVSALVDDSVTPARVLQVRRVTASL